MALLEARKYQHKAKVQWCVGSAGDHQAFTLRSLTKPLLPINTVFSALYRAVPPSMLVKTKLPVTNSEANCILPE